MSTFEPSASARPFVTSGIALAMPPLPVLVPMPAPVRLNQVSSVNVAAPRPGAAPNVTYWLEPLSWRADADPAALADPPTPSSTTTSARAATSAPSLAADVLNMTPSRRSYQRVHWYGRRGVGPQEPGTRYAENPRKVCGDLRTLLSEEFTPNSRRAGAARASRHHEVVTSHCPATTSGVLYEVTASRSISAAYMPVRAAEFILARW